MSFMLILFVARKIDRYYFYNSSIDSTGLCGGKTNVVVN